MIINTIIFDLSEVYLQGIVGSEKTLGSLIRKDVVPLDFVNTYLRKYFQGAITEEEYLRSTITDNHWSITPIELAQILRNNFKEIKGMREIIEALRRKGYKLGLLSVHGKEWIEYCERIFNYRNLFNVVHYSYERKISKPEKRAYIEIVKELHSKPRESIFIDDLLENINVAKSLGFNVVQFINATRLIKDLENLGVKI